MDSNIKTLFRTYFPDMLQTSFDEYIKQINKCDSFILIPQPRCSIEIKNGGLPELIFYDYDVGCTLNISVKDSKLCIWDFPVRFEMIKPNIINLSPTMLNNVSKIYSHIQRQQFQAFYNFFKGNVANIDNDNSDINYISFNDDDNNTTEYMSDDEMET